MANISGYLSEIMGAIYGEEVRTSIYNSIYAINAECEGIMSSAKDSIDTYINEIELYKYVSELPTVGDEQTLYVVQNSISYENLWSDDYAISKYGSSILDKFPVYLAIEPQEEQRECPSYLSASNFASNLVNPHYSLDHNFAVIVHISEYSEGKASVINPEYAMLVVSISASTNLADSDKNIVANVFSILSRESNIAKVDTPINKNTKASSQALEIPWDLYSFTSTRTMSGNYVSILSSLSDSDKYILMNSTFRYLHVNVKEYIYDSVDEKWVYNNIYSQNDIYITNRNPPLTLANTNGTGLVDGLKLSDINFSKYGWLVGIIRSTTPSDSYILYTQGMLEASQYTVQWEPARLHNNTCTVYLNKSSKINGLMVDNPSGEYSTPNLKHPLQKISDTTYAGVMYVWNNALQHYIMLKAGAEVETSEFLYQFIVTPNDNHMYPSDTGKWRDLAQNWSYLGTKGIISKFKTYNVGHDMYLARASYDSSSDVATFRYFSINISESILYWAVITLDCTNGTFSHTIGTERNITSTNLLVDETLNKTSSGNDVTLGVNDEYIPTGYTATIPANNWHSVAASTYATGITIADVSLDSSKNYLINVAATSSSRTDWLNNQVSCSGITGTNTFSFVATSEPQSDIDIYVTIQRINGSTVITQS